MVTPWYGGSGGGVAVMTETLVHSLQEAGVRCVVAELVGDGWWPHTRLGAHGELIVSLCIRQPDPRRSRTRGALAGFRTELAQRTVRHLVRAHGLRTAHFHYVMPAYSILERICRESRLVTLATFHGSDVSALVEPDARSTAAQLLRSCAAVTTVSAALRRRLSGSFPYAASTAQVIHNSYSTEFADIAQSVRATRRDIEVLFVGNLNASKGVDVLLGAIAVLRHRGTEVHAMIAGDGPDRRDLESLARGLDLGSLVTFVGRQDRAVLPSLFSRTRLLVVPSRAEGFGLVILEGQLCGAAVIASDVGGIPEVLRHGRTGLLFRPEDPVSLADAIALLQASPALRDNLAAAGRARALREFSPGRMANKYASLYREASISQGVPQLREAYFGD